MLADDAPLIVTGMHRSGTSMVASLLHAAGVNMGRVLLGAGAGNKKGHFEDADFLHLHETFLRNQGLNKDGWIASDEVTPLPTDRELARQMLVKKRTAAGGQWGWKDPRTTLFLDFWNKLVPDAGWIFLYRHPWDVVDSLARRGGDAALRESPVLAVLSWVNYNTALLRFIRTNRQKCLLVCSDAVAARAKEFLVYVNATFGTALGPVNTGMIDREMMHAHSASSWQAQAIAAVCPEALRLFEDLQAESQMKVPPADVAVEPRRLGMALVDRWVGQYLLMSEHATLGRQFQELQRTMVEKEQLLRELQQRLAAVVK